MLCCLAEHSFEKPQGGEQGNRNSLSLTRHSLGFPALHINALMQYTHSFDSADNYTSTSSTPFTVSSIQSLTFRVFPLKKTWWLFIESPAIRTPNAPQPYQTALVTHYIASRLEAHRHRYTADSFSSYISTFSLPAFSHRPMCGYRLAYTDRISPFHHR